MTNAKSNTMTRVQAHWAQQHDWCRGVVCTNVTKDQWLVMVRDEELPQGSRVFTDYQELRAWAGY